jgi:hypothetical protein
MSVGRICTRMLQLVAEELAEIGRLLKREAPHRWLGRQA